MKNGQLYLGIDTKPQVNRLLKAGFSTHDIRIFASWVATFCHSYLLDSSISRHRFLMRPWRKQNI